MADVIYRNGTLAVELDECDTVVTRDRGRYISRSTDANPEFEADVLSWLLPHVLIDKDEKKDWG